MSKPNAQVYDKRFDKSLATKGDLQAMEENVRGWCDQVRRDVLGWKHDVDAALADMRTELGSYREDDLKYRQAIAARKFGARVRRAWQAFGMWLVRKVWA